jgi:hypothetical protein
MAVNNVLNRKMFNGGNTNTSTNTARGTGITSGLTDRFEDKLAQVQSLNLFPQQAKPRFLDIYGPSLQSFFGALASGRSDAPGKVGRATDILGQALQASAPAMAQAGALRRQLESVDPSAKEKQLALQLAMQPEDPRFEYKVVGNKLIKIDTKGELPPEEAISLGDEERPTATGADGFLYYLDGNKERVFPNVTTPEDQRPTAKGADGFLYYTDGNKERVFPDIKQTTSERPTGKAADGYLYFLDGDRERVFPNVTKPEDQRPTAKGADGYLYYTDGDKERVFPDATRIDNFQSVQTVYGSFGGQDADFGQMFVYDNKVEYLYNGKKYEVADFAVKEKPKDAPTPIFKSQNIGDGMIQDVISFDNGQTFENFGQSYPRIAKEDDEYKYSNTQSTIITRDNKKVKQTYAIYNKEGVTEPKKYLMFEEDVTEGDTVRKSGNLRITTGPNQGQVFAYVEQKDGSIQVHDPMNPLGNDTGLVDIKEYGGQFTFFGQTLVGDKETIFGEKNLEDIAELATNTTLELASGAKLINNAIALDGNLDTLNRAILDKGGKFLAQLPFIGEELRDELFNALDADKEQLDEFLVQARIFVAQQISTITGEDSARVSEPERFLANQALALLDTMTDSKSAINAIQTAMSATYIGQHRNLMVLGGSNAPPLVAGDGLKGFNEANALIHANFLRNNFGFSNRQIQSTLETMKLMEEVGLAQLTAITDDQNASIINNKDRHKNTFDTLVAGANQ